MANTVAELTRLRGNIKVFFTTSKTWLDKPKTEFRSNAESKNRLSYLQKRFTEFTEVHNQLVCIDDSENAADSHSLYLVDIEELYLKLCSRIETLLHENFTTEGPSEHDAESVASDAVSQRAVGKNQRYVSIKLPKIKLPEFEGKVEDWPSFLQRFENALGRENVSDLDRFEFLVQSLKGDAAALIKNIPVIASNYEAALSILRRRYENKRLNLFQLPRVIENDEPTLRKLLDITSANIRALENLGYVRDGLANELSTQLIVTKLDTKSKELLEIRVTQQDAENEASESDDTPTDYDAYADLSQFLEGRLRVISSVYSVSSSKRNKPDSVMSSVSSKNIRASKTVLATTTSPTNSSTDSPKSTKTNSRFSRQCPVCTLDHALFMCDEFKRLSIQDRYNKVRALKICVNCFGKSHWANNCQAIKCKLCDKPHHTLLHPTDNDQSMKPAHNTLSTEATGTSAPAESTAATNSAPKTTVMTTTVSLPDVLLATANVHAYSNDSARSVSVTALFDGGAHSTFITTRLAQKLQLKRFSIAATVSGFGGASAAAASITTLCIKSVNGEFSLKFSAIVTDVITEPLPHTSFELGPEWAFVNDYTLADPNFNQSKRIDILIGADILYDVLLPDFIRRANSPVLQASRVGWLLAGPFSAASMTVKRRCLFVSSTSTASDLDVLTRFWEIEEPPSSGEKLSSASDIECERLFVETHERINGRFSVRLPIRNSASLGESYHLALKCLQKTSLTDEYLHFMKEYEQLGHMSRVTQSSETTYYIPHHAVYRDNKIRVVFDASMKTSSGVSLNDILPPGPTLQSSVFDILIQFRCHKYAFTTDIVKMYRQILINKTDRHWQHILLRKANEIIEFELNTVTYGMTCAPYLAIRCLLQLADDERSRYPEAAAALKNDSYVDDIITGASTLSRAIALRDQLVDLLASAGMKLDKWHANDCGILPEGKSADTSNVKTLGIFWNTADDCLSVPAPSSPSSVFTKRSLSSFLSSIYDPLGILAPITISGKVLLQSVWMTTASWDAPLDKQTSQAFERFVNDAQSASDFRIPRYLGVSEDSTFELHGFADSSGRAYAGCVYIRARMSNGLIRTSLICAKTRLAPQRIKRTIPELELCAALLLTELLSSIASLLHCPQERCTAYSDSSVVLAYLSKDPNTWKVFVANRVRKILALLPRDHWKHIPGNNNPADIATRPQSLTVFKQRQDLWFDGPEFLQRSTLPTFGDPDFDESTLTYLRVQPIVSLVVALAPTAFEINFNRFSSYSRMVRSVAYVHRYISILRARSTHTPPPHGLLTVNEVELAERSIFEQAQKQAFPKEFMCLESHQSLPSRSVLRSLAPRLTDGLIRVGGRLENASLPFPQRHPIILPVQHRLTKLLIRDTHRSYRHAGTRFCIATMQRRFYFIGNLTSAVQKCIRTCIRCVRFTAPLSAPPMGDLPADRVIPDFPFANVDIDYAGPISTKPSIRSRAATTLKSYIAVFVCMVTKSVHLEVVSDLSSTAFIACFQRFIARRGLPHTVHSDNGTNFTGASAEFDRQFQALLQSEVVRTYATQRKISWRFIPPASPHMGGLWEAAVKSMKFHLRRSIGNQVLTFEELTTVVCNVESVLNSRPLVPVVSKDSLDALTPGHFLIGRPLIALPEPNPSPRPNSQRWQLLSQIRQTFWKRWHDEYLVSLHRRNKWQLPSRPFAINDIVLIRGENVPPLLWPGAETYIFPMCRLNFNREE